MIRLEHVKKSYPNITPLADINAEIQDGDVIAVIGPSGTGKSTLLRCINLLERPDGGKIYINDEEITAPSCDIHRVRQKMGMVFQSFNLFGHLTVIENIMLAPVKLKGMGRNEAFSKGMELLRTVGLSEKMLDYPDELSGGQKQRIAIARTLAMDPDIILLDEPTSALDPTMVGEVQAVVRDLTKTGKTLMIVTHEMNFARNVCSRVFYLDEGIIYEDGSPKEIFENPKHEKTRRFINRLKVLVWKIEGKNFDFPGAASEADNYCRKNLIPQDIRSRFHSVIKELVQQILFAELEEPCISIVTEYSELDEGIVITVRYNGDRFDPADTDNKISYGVLKAAVSEIHYRHEVSGEYSNTVQIVIR